MWICVRGLVDVKNVDSVSIFVSLVAHQVHAGHTSGNVAGM